MLKLYKFYWNYGRHGEVDGLFLATKEEIAAAIGKNVVFGEILGKHSYISGVLDSEDFTILSEDAEFIAQLLKVFDGKQTISGYNPLHYIEECY